MVMPVVAATRTPDCVLSQMIWIALVIDSAPTPPGSRQLISPPAAVLGNAPWKVLHGAVRLHGLTSSPTPEIQVRVACADAGAMHRTEPATAARTNMVRAINDMKSPRFNSPAILTDY